MITAADLAWFATAESPEQWAERCDAVYQRERRAGRVFVWPRLPKKFDRWHEDWTKIDAGD